MICPRCRSSDFDLMGVCHTCHFNGNGRALERLANLTFLLEESAQWVEISPTVLEQLQNRYRKQRRELEVELGLRQPPPDVVEAHALRAEQERLQMLLTAVTDWKREGWLAPVAMDRITADIQQQLASIEDRLLDAPPTSDSLFRLKRILRQWEQKRFLAETVERLHQSGDLTTIGYDILLTQLKADIEALEIKAGLRPAIAAVEPLEPEPGPEDAADKTITLPDEKAVPRRKREPITWDRIWETLLSERTLQAILFLGAMLLFAAGVSWVAWNWDTFPPVLQVAFLGGLTAVFYSLGWYVRSRMALRGSGIALSAVGSLLVPLDFYAFYLSGGFPPGSWPQVWLLASAVCLGAYVLTTYLIQAEFFGYLVGMAAGSLVVATLNLADVHINWWQTGLASTVLALALISEGLSRGLIKRSQVSGDSQAGKSWQAWLVFARPFAQVALVAAPVILLLGLGLGFLGGRTGRIFHLAVALNWWLGGVALALLVHRYRSRSLALAAALAFPIAIWLTQRWLLQPTAMAAAWYALGWSLLIHLYLLITRWLGQQAARTGDEITVAYSQIVLRVSAVLVAVSAVWSLGNTGATSVVHPLLAATMLLAARLWRQPRLLWLTSLFLVVGSAAWQGGRGATPAELALPWALLSVLHVIVALRLSKQALTARFDEPLYGAAIAIAGLALLPPLLLGDRTLLVYSLGNWIGINGWLAYLAHGENAPGLRALLSRPRWQRFGPALHWFTALAIVPWLWLAWTNGRPATPPLALAYALLAWGLLWLCTRLRRLRWAYGRPWQTAAHLSNISAIIIGVASYEQPWLAATLLLLAAFYTTAAWLLHRPRWLLLAGLIFPAGWLLALDWLPFIQSLLYYRSDWLAALVPAYLLAAWLIRSRGADDAIVESLYKAAVLIGQVVFFWSAGLLLIFALDDPLLFYPAWSALLLGAGYAVHAWLTTSVRWAHIAIWLATAGGGLLVKVYSQGSGRSAALIALMSVVYVLAERGLRYLALTRRKAQGQVFRQAWRLYRRPLLVAGWIVSAGAIGAALVRNLLLLGGGPTRQAWAIVALLIITGLYALSARLFRRPRFAWLASALVVFPWVLLTDLALALPLPDWEWYALSGLLLGLALTAVGIGLAQRLGLGRWSWPPLAVAHVVVPLALAWGGTNTAVTSLTAGLALAFYVTAVWIDAHFRAKATPANARFLYPAAFLAPVWAVYLLLYAVPAAQPTTVGLLLLTFTLPLLGIGRQVARREPAYRWPLYLAAYSTAVGATMLVAAVDDRPILISVLLFDTALAVLSVWLFREPTWWYSATLTLPSAAVLFLQQVGVPAERHGWALVALGGLYLWGAQQLRRRDLRRYETPLIAMMFVLVVLGLPASSLDWAGALVGYGLAAAVYATAAVWLRQPIVLSLAVALAFVTYWAAARLLGMAWSDGGLAAWPGIALALWLALRLDNHWGIEPTADALKLSSSFPWYQPWRWPAAVWERWSRWWAFSLYGMAYGMVPLSALWAIATDWQWLLVLLAGTVVFAWTTLRFRLRGWLLVTGLWGQLTALALIRWLGWADTPAQVALAFMPVTLLTLLAGMAVERLRQEGPPLVQIEGRWRWQPAGWSRPFYLLLLANLVVSQLLAWVDTNGASTAVTLLNGLIVAALATFWQLPVLAYGATTLGLFCLFEGSAWQRLPQTAQSVALAVLAVVYGVAGYALLYHAGRMTVARPWVWLWQRPLRLSGWFVSALAIFTTLPAGVNVLDVAMQSLIFAPPLRPGQVAQIQSVVLVMAILGLFYLAAAVVERWRRASYGALAMLLSAWGLWLWLLQGQRELQLYAIPAGVYLLGIGWLEWQQGNRALARWIDRAGLLLLLGSAFWQSFGPWGGAYAALMLLEGLLLVWLGSLRHLRRFLYAGVVGALTAVAGQLIEPLFALNTFALLLLGALLVALGIGLERRLEKVRVLSQELRLKLEDWE